MTTWSLASDVVLALRDGTTLLLRDSSELLLGHISAQTELWTEAVKQAESWNAVTAQTELWTERAKDVEIWRSASDAVLALRDGVSGLLLRDGELLLGHYPSQIEVWTVQ